MYIKERKGATEHHKHVAQLSMSEILISSGGRINEHQPVEFNTTLAQH